MDRLQQYLAPQTRNGSFALSKKKEEIKMRGVLRLRQEIGRTIRQLRLKNGVKQTDLACDVNLTTRHFQKIESGQVDIKASTVESIAHTLNSKTCFLCRPSSMKALESSGISCPVELLDLLPFGVQVCDTQGEISYLNKKQREIIGLGLWEKNSQPLYIWDCLADPCEKKDLQNHLRILVEEQPLSTPYHMKNFTKDAKTLPVKMEWIYILDREKKVTGLVLLVTPHPCGGW